MEYNHPSSADYARESANEALRRIKELEGRVNFLEHSLEEAVKLMNKMAANMNVLLNR